MRKQLLFLLSFILFICANQLSAQINIVIVGQVLDKADEKPISNASVFFKNSNIGTSTDKDGYYILRSKTAQTEIEYSMMGYKKKSIKIKNNESKAINIELIEKVELLPELFIFPGQNPAIELMEKVRATRLINNPELCTAYQALVEENIKASFSLKSRNSLNKRIFSDLQKGLLSTDDSTLFFPVYYSQENYYLKSGEKTPLNNKSKSVFLSKEESMKELVNKLPLRVNFYDNYLFLFGKNFLSPLASTAENSYKYYIKDSIRNILNKEYILSFQPTNKKSLAFEGTMHIDSASYAITKITATLPKIANINFIKRLGFSQQFVPFNNKWVFEKQATIVNLQLSKKENTSNSFFIVKNSNYNFSNSSTSDISSFAEKQDSAFNKALDSLSSTKQVKALNTLADIIINKYIHVGAFDIGPFNLLANSNKVEGTRFTMGGRTGEKISENFTIGGYGGYGISDQKWKYGAEIQYRFKKKHYTLIGLKYDNNMYQTDFNYHDDIRHENSIINGLAGIASAFFSGDRNYTQLKKTKLFLDKEWIKGLQTKLILSYGEHLPNNFVPYTTTASTISSVANYNITLDFRLSNKERIMEEYFHRIYLSNYYPVSHFVIQGGKYETTVSNDYYLKFHTYTKQTLLLGNFGKFRYSAEAGLILGQVPFPLLELYSPYESNGISRYAIHPEQSNMYAADSYIKLKTSVLTNGLLFNLIPLVNRLNLRETVGIKVAYGSLQEKNEKLMNLPVFIEAMDTPIIQLSAGITNLFKIIAIEYIWAFPKIKNPNANWGIQARLSVDF